MHTAFHAYYRQPPPPAEVEALCDAVFLAHDDGVSPPSPTERRPPAASVSLHRFVDLARGQPALAQCFSALSKPLHTPRVVRAADGAAASAPAAASSFETFMPLLLPMCAIRRKPPRDARRRRPEDARRAAAAQLAAAQVGGVGRRRRSATR